MPRILLTNDDGVMSPGLWALRKAIAGSGDCVIVAPAGPRSATSMSLTFHKPLRITKVSVNGVEAFSVSGNPADCVSLAVNHILKGKKMDVVLSGINPGDNTTAQVIYASGTVAAAMQAAIMGIKAVAFSAMVQEGHTPGPEEYETRLSGGLQFAKRLVKKLVRRGLPKGVDFLNVNFPLQIKDPRMVRITRLGKRRFENFIVRRLDPRRAPYYWQTGSALDHHQYEKGTDVHALQVEHCISVTPISLDISAKADLVSLRELIS